MPSCKDCKSIAQNLIKLPFGGHICMSCMDKTCEIDQSVTGTQHISIIKPKQISNSENIGVKLYKIKEDINDFHTDLNQFEDRLAKKFDSIKYDITVNFEYCLNEINRSKQQNQFILDAYESDLINKIKKSKDENKFQVLNQLHAQYIDYFNNKIAARFNELNKINNDSNLELATITNFKLDEIEKDLDSFDKFISEQNVLLNQSFFSNKMITFLKKKNNNSNFGCLKINSREDTSIQMGPYLTNLISKSNTIHNSNPSSIHSINLINEFDTEMIILTTKLMNDYKLNIYNIKTGDLLKQELITLKEKTIFLLNSNSSNLIICHSNDPIHNFNNYELILYDKQLNVIKQCKKFVVSSIPIDIFINKDKIYLLSIVKETNMPIVSIIDLDLNETLSFTINNIDFNKKNANSADFKLFIVENTLFLKQNHLFGTRLNVIDCNDGLCLKKIELNFFLRNNNFLIDKSFKLITFTSNDYKFLIYDLNAQKLVFKTSFDQAKHLMNSICLNRDGNIISLMNCL